jgi:hypothetical protein
MLALEEQAAALQHQAAQSGCAPQPGNLTPPQRSRHRWEARVIAGARDVGRDARLCGDAHACCDVHVVFHGAFAAHYDAIAERGGASQRHLTTQQASAGVKQQRPPAPGSDEAAAAQRMLQQASNQSTPAHQPAGAPSHYGVVANLHEVVDL